MPKFKGGFGINADEAIENEFDGSTLGYQGPTPPAGPFRGILKRLEMKRTSETAQKYPNNPMLNILVEIKEPEGSPKAKYNGYGIWNNQLITEQSQPYVNAFLNSLAGGDEKKARAIKTWFWKEQINTERSDGGHILAIGKFKINSPDAEIPVIVSTKRGDDNQGGERLEIKRWLVPNPDEPKEDEFDADDPTIEDEFDDGTGSDEFDDSGEPGF